MTNLITFQDKQIKTTTLNGQIALSSDQLAKGLGYSRADQISRIYDRHKDEFTPDMSDTVNLTVSGNLQTTTRLFSSRGCHLIAMFARTPFAKEFRKWVLDVLEKQNQIVQPNQKQLDLIPVKEYTRRLPSGKKEIVLSDKARSEIGGIVKSCVGVAIREALKPVCVSQFKTDETQTETERNLYMAIKAYGDERERNGLIKALCEYKTYFEIADILKQATPIQISAK